MYEPYDAGPEASRRLSTRPRERQSRRNSPRRGPRFPWWTSEQSQSQTGCEPPRAWSARRARSRIPSHGLSTMASRPLTSGEATFTEGCDGSLTCLYAGVFLARSRCIARGAGLCLAARNEVRKSAPPQPGDNPVRGVVVHAKRVRDRADRPPPLERGRQEPHPQRQPRVLEDGARLVVEYPAAALAPVSLVERLVPPGPYDPGRGTVSARDRPRPPDRPEDLDAFLFVELPRTPISDPRNRSVRSLRRAIHARRLGS